MYTSIDICAGAGGQALGLEQAGFKHIALVEYGTGYCERLKRSFGSAPILHASVSAKRTMRSNLPLDLAV